MNILSMSINQWTRYLTEEGLTMEGENPRRYILCRSELSSPHTDWEQCWRLSRLPGLGSDLSSFNFKLLHQLLVTRQRLHHLNPQTPPTCNLCVTDIEDDLQHAFISCNYNNGVDEALLRIVEEHVPDINPPTLADIINKFINCCLNEMNY